MTITQIIIAVWLGGWAISVGAYLRSSMKRAQMSGLPWSPRENLAVVPVILVTWLPSLIIYVRALIKARARGI
jgi:hypothetical protein